MKIIAAGEDIDPADLEGVKYMGKELRGESFYLTPDSMFRIKEFPQKLGISTAGRNLGECIPEAHGHEVLITLALTQSKKNPEEFFTNVASMTVPG